jgi:hypothetical protein
MKMSIKFLVLACFAIFLLTRCTSKADSITEPKFGTFTFTTYTVDTFRFRVILNGEVLTDSLLSPQSSFSKIISFFNSTARLLILDADNHGQVILDSIIQMKIGNTTIPIVQFGHSQKPSLPPVSNEPAPAEGSYKMRFQYIQPIASTVPFFDSIQCIVREGGNPVDTIILEQNELSPFYEGKTNISSFTLKLEKPDGTTLHTAAINGIGSNFTGLNTAVFYGSEGSGSPNYRFTLKYVY